MKCLCLVWVWVWMGVEVEVAEVEVEVEEVEVEETFFIRSTRTHRVRPPCARSRYGKNRSPMRVADKSPPLTMATDASRASLPEGD